MGKVITRKIRGMSWTAKVSLVLLCTVLTSVFMYQGWYKPKGAQAAIASLSPWSSVYNNTAYPTTITNYTVPLGDKRLLVVGITSTTSAAVAQTMTSVTYNGLAMTPAPNNDNGANVTHSYLFSLPLGTSASATTANIVVNMSGGTSSRTYVYAAAYSGVDQSAPIRDSKAFNSTATSTAVGPFSPNLTCSSGDVAVEMINLTRTGSSSASSARTISTWSTGWSSALSTTTGVTSNPNYAINAYAATYSAGTVTSSQHTASSSSSLIKSMAAMSIKAFTGPTVTSAFPEIGNPGQTLDVTITGANFVSGATVDFGSGITVNTPITFNSSISLTANITIAPGATTGVRTVTVTNPDLTTGTGNVFAVVSATTPTIDTVTPTALGQGATNISVAITGSNFDATSAITFSGTGVIAVTNFIDSTHLTAAVTVTGTATVGTRNMTVTNSSDGSNSTKTGAFTVNARPTVTLATPAFATPGSTLNVIITGTGFVNGANVTFGNGITVNGAVTFTNATSLTANITVAADATLGSRNITVTNPDYGNGTNSSTVFSVAGPAPTITSLSPSAVGRGATNVPFTITGTNFDPLATVTWSGSSVTLGTMTVQSSTTITGTIASVSGTGTSTITVTNPDSQIATSTLTLNTYPSAPTVNPTNSTQGTTLNVTVGGGNMVNGATVSFSGTGITVNGTPTWNSASSLTVNITIADDATPGTRSVTVTNPDYGTRTASNIFTVNSAAPVLSTATPSLVYLEASNLDVTISGRYFVSGALVNFGGNGVTVNSVTWNSGSSLTANISVSSSATLGARTMTVTNPDGKSGSNSSIFTVSKVPETITGAMKFSLAPNYGLKVTVYFNGDGNSNNTCTLNYGKTLGAYSETAVLTRGDGFYTVTLNNLDRGLDGEGVGYFFKAEFTDQDGVNGTNPIFAAQSSPANPMMHNSQNLMSTKWADGWGIPNGKYNAFTCTTCHNNTTTNNKMVGMAVLGTWSSQLPVAYRNKNTDLGNDSAHETSTNICEVCHTQTNYHRYNNVNVTSHRGTRDCTVCHTHRSGFSPDPTLACDTCHGYPPANTTHSVAIAGEASNCAACHGPIDTNNTTQHFANPVPVQYGCISCHDKAQGSRDAITTEFGLAWGHKKTGRGAVTDADCVVCHLEGSTETGSISSYHADGNIDLRDPDGAGETPITNISGTAAFAFKRFSTSYAANSRSSNGHLANSVDNVVTQKFCLACHDSNGATNPTARTTGGTQYMPFGGVNLGANYTEANGAAVLGGVVDAKTQFATSNSSNHPVMGPRNNAYPTPVKLTVPYNSFTRTAGTKANGVVLNCFDCHNTSPAPLTTRTVSAHGNANTIRGTLYAASTGGTAVTSPTFCLTCHIGGYNTTNQGHGTGSAITANDSNMSASRFTICANCHFSSFVKPVRPLQAADVHGFNGLAATGGPWTYGNANNMRPIAFMRNVAQWPAVNSRSPRPASATGITTGSANCGNGAGALSGCTGENMNSYTPGGTY
jgi:hypothetical protein